MKAIWRGFSSLLADGIQAYLNYKRALKHKFRTEERALRLLDRYLVEHQITTLAAITPPLIEAFLASRPRKRPRSYNHLLGVMRCFFAWLVVQGRLECSPVLIRAKRATARLQPYLFTPEAKQLLMLAADLRCFFEYLANRRPEMLAEAHRVAGVPVKRTPPPRTRYLERDEVEAVFQNLPKKGKRERISSLAFGARARSKAAGLRVSRPCQLHQCAAGRG